MWSFIGAICTGTPPNVESGPLAENTPITGYEPELPDDFHYSETTEISHRDESSDTVPSYLFDVELDDETIGRALSSPLFVHSGARNIQRTEDKLITLMKKVCCQLSPFLCVTQERERPVHELSSSR